LIYNCIGLNLLFGPPVHSGTVTTVYAIIIRREQIKKQQSGIVSYLGP